MNKLFFIIGAYLRYFFTKRWKGRHLRRAFCADCDSNKKGICGECGCIINIKTNEPTQECPKGIWTAEKP